LKLSIVPSLFAVLLLAGALRAEGPDSLQRPEFWPKGPDWSHGNLFLGPNPVRDNGVITYRLSTDGEASMQMFSMTGNLVSSWMLRGAPGGVGTFQIQFSGIAPGFYVLVLTETIHGKSAITGFFKVAVQH
jgi:hypothetical protein